MPTVPRIEELPTRVEDMLGLAATGAPVVEFEWGPHRIFLVHHPDPVREVLQQDHRVFGKGNFFYDILRRFTGDGLVAADGELWQQQRRITQPGFWPRRIAGLDAVITDQVARHTDGWDDSDEIEVTARLRELSLSAQVQALFGQAVGSRAGTVGLALDLARQAVIFLSMTPIGTLHPHPSLSRAVQLVDRVVKSILIEARSHPPPPETPLALWLKGTESGPMDWKQLRAEIITLLLAGVESNTAALTWTCYLLASHPAAEQRLYHEIERAPDDADASWENLEELPYTKAVLQEALRLYPPVWAVFRTPREEVELGGQRLPAGAILLVSPLITQRHPAFWDQPNAFKPERFLEGGPRHRFAYFPFANGPRRCIGEPFAKLLLTRAITQIQRRYRLDLVPGQSVTPSLSSQIFPEVGLRMRAVAR